MKKSWLYHDYLRCWSGLLLLGSVLGSLAGLVYYSNQVHPIEYAVTATVAIPDSRWEAPAAGPEALTGAAENHPLYLLGWFYRKPISITNPGSALTDYQVLVTLDTTSLILAGNMQVDCDDIRLTDFDGTTLLDHWLESGCNSANTKIWVKVPSIPTTGRTIYMDYGNSEVVTGSDFTTTFPNRYILTSGTDTSTGAQNFDWFEVQLGATFYITDEIPQSITARKILIAGTVNGDGRGFPGATAVGSGQGLGGGSYKSGGGYGGAGGQGFGSAYGAGGQPGSTYRSASSQAIQMGSGGGASDSVQAPGGDGGGNVTFNSQEILIFGTVTMNGGTHNTGTNQNGGGAGGGILIRSSRVNLSGTLSVRGGAGDSGTARAGGAGGGGGGRIKIFSDESISDTSTKIVNGGTGSPGGTAGGSSSSGEPGALGTIHIGTPAGGGRVAPLGSANHLDASWLLPGLLGLTLIWTRQRR